MKRKLLKRSLAFVLTSLMTLSSFSEINIFAASMIPNVTLLNNDSEDEKVVKIDGISYNLISSPTETTPGKAVVSFNKNCTKIDVAIPETISYYNKTYYVTEVLDGAFNSNHNIESITLGKNIEKVSASAFIDCPNLKKVSVEPGNKNFAVENNILFNKSKDKLIYCPPAYDITYYTIPEKVTEIAYAAFLSNRTLYQVTLNSSLVLIDDYAFNNCASLTFINTSNSVEKIGNYAFAQTSLKNILLSKSLKELGEGAFFATNISAITIPKDINVIKNNTFYNCFNLKNIKLYDNIEEIGDYAFAGTPLTNFTMPSSLKSIGYAAFADCENLAKISSNAKLKTIKNNAFYNCDSLLDFVVPTATVEIGDDVFTGCNHINDFKVSVNNTAFEDKDGVLYSKRFEKLLRYPVGKTDNIYTIPTETKEIAVNALADSRYIASYEVEYGNKYFSVQDDILYDFDKTILYEYPSAKTINNFTVPDYVTKIMPRAFANSSIRGIFNISSYVNEIGEGAFDNCKGITEFNILGNNEKFTVVDKVLLSKNEDILVCYPSSGIEEKYTLPESIKSINAFAFKNSKLKEINLNEGLTSIGESAFYGSLTEKIILPETLKDIEESAFESSAIKNIIIPASVVSIGSLAFANCPNLKSIKFDGKEIVETLGYNIFLNTKLEKITVPALLKNDYIHTLTASETNNYKDIINS